MTTRYTFEVLVQRFLIEELLFLDGRVAVGLTLAGHEQAVIPFHTVMPPDGPCADMVRFTRDNERFNELLDTNAAMPNRCRALLQLVTRKGVNTLVTGWPTEEDPKTGTSVLCPHARTTVALEVTRATNVRCVQMLACCGHPITYMPFVAEG